MKILYLNHVKNSNIEIIKNLVKHRVGLNKINKNDETPLFYIKYIYK